MSFVNPSVRYNEQTLDATEQARVRSQISAQEAKEGKDVVSTDLIEKLTNLPGNAQENVIEMVKVNGTAATIDPNDKSVNIAVPANRTVHLAIQEAGTSTTTVADLPTNPSDDPWIYAPCAQNATTEEDPNDPGQTVNVPAKSGFMSAVDKVKLDALFSSIYAKISGTDTVVTPGDSGKLIFAEGNNVTIAVSTDATTGDKTLTFSATGGGGGGGETNVIDSIRLENDSADVSITDKKATIPLAVAPASGSNGKTGVVTASDKANIDNAVQCKVNPIETGTPTLLPQQLFVVESDSQIIDIVQNHSSDIGGKGTLFFRITGV